MKALKKNLMQKDDKIFIAGGTGLVGSAIIRSLQQSGYSNLVATYHGRPPQDDSVHWVQLDLTDQVAVQSFFEAQAPSYVFLAAAKVGGIMANNTYRADFIFENLQIQNNIIHQSYKSEVRKLLFLGSTCIYPRDCPQPMKEDYLLTSPLEYTNEPYAMAKIAGIKMCESYNLQYGTNFISVMPTNLYGPGDNFDLETSHVLPALLRKMHLGKCLEQNDWESLRSDLNARPIGSIDGTSPDDAILGALNEHGIYSSLTSASPVKQPAGLPVTDRGFTGDHRPLTSVSIWGTGSPKREFMYSDGTPRKLLDVSRLHELGCREKVSLEEGIAKLYAWYRKHCLETRSDTEG